MAALEGQTALQMVLVFYPREPLGSERAGAQMLATWPRLAESSRVGTPGPHTLGFSSVLKMSQKLFSQSRLAKSHTTPLCQELGLGVGVA